VRSGIGKIVLAIETFVAIGVLAGCGGDGEPAASTTPAAQTASPTATASTAPTATATATAPPAETPTPTATPDTGGADADEPDTGGTEAGELDQGDEAGIGTPVDVLVTPERIVVTPEVVPAFLPLELTVTNGLDRAIDIVVIQAGGDGQPVGRARVRPSEPTVIKVDGMQPGSGEVLSPDLDPDQTAFFDVQRD
jgi:hypothetical protein